MMEADKSVFETSVCLKQCVAACELGWLTGFSAEMEFQVPIWFRNQTGNDNEHESYQRGKFQSPKEGVKSRRKVLRSLLLSWNQGSRREAEQRPAAARALRGTEGSRWTNPSHGQKTCPRSTTGRIHVKTLRSWGAETAQEKAKLNTTGNGRISLAWNSKNLWLETGVLNRSRDRWIW